MNPNQIFNLTPSESIRAQIGPNRIFNLSQSESFQRRIDSDEVGFKTWFGSIRIDASD